MKKRLLPLLVISLLILAGWYLWAGSHPAAPVAVSGTPSKTPSPTASDYSVGDKFSGAVTADECATSPQPIGDVGCYITVDGKKVTVLHGNARPTHPWGSFDIHNQSPNAVGKTVDVYAHRLADGTYTLEGSSSFYVKVSE
jgi:hypothetical protein